eukprot:TRINITY_DN30_c1_g1_i1.p1 TRINITY_DN30_c1_g1~~TRINITY_DN30_c1_g1_i1.p1  ORF type:complete len:321 (-),score=96.89 TRINITY_DN30_c1_g1_i1:62-1024(-)
MATLENQKIVLVTGGTGLVGQAIKKIATQQNDPLYHFIFVGSQQANLINFEETRNLFEKYKPNFVIHLAAMVGGLFKNLRQNVEFFRYNMSINDNILNCCRIYNVEKCVSCLSTCIFPDKITYPINETQLHLGPPHSSNEGYSYAKRMLEVLSRLYNNQYGSKFVCVVPTNVYGPHDNYNLEDSHVIPGLIHKCYNSMKQNSDFVVWGSGKPLRQFIFSEDLARLFLWVLKNYEKSEPLILSVAEKHEVSIETVATLISKSMNFNGNLIFDSSKADGQFKKTVSNERLMELIPDFQFTPIEIAIEESCQWFLQNYETARK